MQMKRKKLLTVLALFVAGCLWSASGFLMTASSQTNSLSEGFEAGGKTAYAAANVTLGSGSWYLDEALTGNSGSDRKTGSWLARVRNTGRVRMNFNAANAGTVSVSHAVYGADGASSWELWKSTSGGSTWTKVGLTMSLASYIGISRGFGAAGKLAIKWQDEPANFACRSVRHRD